VVLTSLLASGHHGASSRSDGWVYFRHDCGRPFCGYVQCLCIVRRTAQKWISLSLKSQQPHRHHMGEIHFGSVFRTGNVVWSAIRSNMVPVQLLIAIAIPLVLVGLLKEKNLTVTASAVTWYANIAFSKNRRTNCSLGPLLVVCFIHRISLSSSKQTLQRIGGSAVKFGCSRGYRVSQPFLSQ